MSSLIQNVTSFVLGMGLYASLFMAFRGHKVSYQTRVLADSILIFVLVFMACRLVLGVIL